MGEQSPPRSERGRRQALGLDSSERGQSRLSGTPHRPRGWEGGQGGPPSGPRPHCWGKGRGLRSARDRAGRRQRRRGRRGGQARPRSWAVRLTSAPGLRSQSGQDPSQLRRGDPDALQPFRHLRRCCNSCSDAATAARSQETTADGRRARSPTSHLFPRPLPSSSPPPRTTVAALGGKALNGRSAAGERKRPNAGLGVGGGRRACAEVWSGKVRGGRSRRRGPCEVR